MSSKRKIILGIIVGFLFIGAGIFTYLTYTGKIKLGAAGPIFSASRGAALSKGAIQPSKTWYFAEGCTRTNFDTFLLIQNPNGKKTKVKVTYVFSEGQGSPVIKEYEVQPTSRMSIYVEGYTGAEKDVAMKVESEKPIIAERVMYFIYNGRFGSSSNLGSPILSKTWYLPEGTTWHGFDEWILVYNHNNEDIKLKVRFFLNDKIENKEIIAKANARTNIKVNDLLGDYKGDVATLIYNDKEKQFIAERAMYFNTGDKSGGSSSLGIIPQEASKSLYFAESYVTSSNSFDEWLAVLNPYKDKKVNTQLYAILNGQEIKLDEREIDSSKRTTFHINDYKDKGIIDQPSLSLMLKSNEKILAERSIYINHNLGNNVFVHDGVCEKGVPVEQISKNWYLPEGYTSNQNNRDFIEYLIILNPQTIESECKIKFIQPDGKVSEKSLVIPAKTRKELLVNDVLTGEHSIQVESTQEVVVERVIYHNTVVPPSISSIEPNSGFSPTEVTISGSNFIDVENVLLNDQPIQYALINVNTIKTKISGEPGDYNLAVKTKRGTSNKLTFTIKRKETSIRRRTRRTTGPLPRNCNDGDTRCQGNNLMICRNNEWQILRADDSECKLSNYARRRRQCYLLKITRDSVCQLARMKAQLWRGSASYDDEANKRLYNSYINVSNACWSLTKTYIRSCM